MRSVCVWLLAMVAGVPLLCAPVEAGPPVQLQTSNSPRRSSWEGLAIVVNQKNPVANVRMGQLRDIMMAQRQWWSNHRRIRLVAMPRGSVERQTVLRAVYQMTDHQVDTYFLAGVFRGDIDTSPSTLRGPADVRRFVSATPGALGYIRASDVDNTVKVVRIDGLLPGDDGYPLRLRQRTAQ